MHSQNEQLRYSSSSSISTAMLGKTAGKHGYLSQNLLPLRQSLLPTNSASRELSTALIYKPCTTIMTRKSDLLPQKNNSTQWLLCITTSTTCSNESTRNKVPYVGKSLNNTPLTTGFWLIVKTSNWRLRTICYQLANSLHHVQSSKQFASIPTKFRFLKIHDTIT